jgi:Flp pilus assembly protein TadG
MRRLLKWKSESGAALVEFAITVPLLFLIVWGAIDFARAYYTSNSLASAVREGARYAVVFQNPTANADAIKAKVKQSFNAFGGDTILDAAITVYDSTAVGTPVPGNVTVEVKNYVWKSTTPLNIFTGGQILMTRRAKFRWELEPT